MFALFGMLVVLLGLVTAISQGRDSATHRDLPGMRADGYIQLPNQWRLRPAGSQLEIGDFPVQLVLHPSSKWAVVLHAGYGEHELVSVSLQGARPRIVSRVRLDQAFYGVTFSPDGRKILASGGEYEVIHQFDFNQGYFDNPRTFPVAEQTDKFVPGGIAIDSTGSTAFVCGTFGDSLVRLSLIRNEDRKRIPLPKVRNSAGKARESFPYTCILDQTGDRLFVSLWNRASIAILDTKKDVFVAEWPTESHPTEMVLSPDGKTIFVACANSTKVSVLDTATGNGIQTITSSLYPHAPSGNTPNSLALSPDGKVLFVANADSNNIALFNVENRTEAKPLGFIPVGHYPTSVRYSAGAKKILVANGKGSSPKSNRHGPIPTLSFGTSITEYIGGLYRGTLSVIDMPTPERLSQLTKQAFNCSPLQADSSVTGDRPADNPIPARVGEKSPIKHCIYIVKENRTYDQVFGDLPQGKGDPSLCLFPDRVTPNHHKLAREFVLLDNFYVDGEVSADGHEWTMGAYATDYVEKYWPVSYRGSPFRKFGYPSEGNHDEIARPSGGYIWDRCAEAGVSYFSFGEWIENGKTPNDPARATVKALEGHFDPLFRGYDLDFTDVKRAERFIQKLGEFEQKGSMPSFIVLRLPNDHTSGTRIGKPTPTAMVADNDLALGMVVEAISKSRFWKESAIFVIEDDAQNGPDHVDAHRAVALVVSPYTKRRFVDSTLYSTTSMLRTMELILGLKPMSQFDAAARPMYASFQAAPDLRPYVHLPAGVDLNEKNKPGAFGARLSEEFNLAREDQADDLMFNEIIWRSVRGNDSRMPPPVRAAFLLPRVKD
jgi:YVTN family beta-propeller protein